MIWVPLVIQFDKTISSYSPTENTTVYKLAANAPITFETIVMVMIGMLIKTITKFVERDWLSPTQFKHKGQCRSQMPCSFFLFIALVQTLITVQILRALRYLTLCNFA